MYLDPPRDFRGVFRSDELARALYSEAAGIGRILPAAVAVPRDADDVGAIVRWAAEGGYSLIARGSGSSMAGGAIGPGVVLDLSRLRDWREPDAATRSIRVGAGTLRGEVHRRATTVGLRFPVDPSSGEFCTVGGMAATNAAGPHSLRHGSMRPWVLALDCVFSDGSQGRVRRGSPPPENPAVTRFMRTVHPDLLAQPDGATHKGVLKESSGYAVGPYAQSMDLVDLLVGSEGTLALFTAVEVALMPSAAARGSILVSYPDVERAVDGAIAAREQGAAACELLDRTFLEIASSGGTPLPVSPLADAVLLIELESDDPAAISAEADRLLRSLRRTGAADAILALDQVKEQELWAFRHAASPALAHMNPRLKSMQFIEDAAVPPASLGAYVRGLRSILAGADTPGVIFGHAGDAHVHVNPLVDVGDPLWRSRVEQILDEVTSLVARLEGTLSGEHGDGRLRTPLLDRVWTAPARRQFERIKRAFDPDGILNPGVKVPVADQRPIELVKYDPLADMLPSRAREALNVVERERAYSRYRLEML